MAAENAVSKTKTARNCNTLPKAFDENGLPIEEPEEMEEVGFDDYLYGDGICLIEWAEQVRELLPENIISVTITKNPEKGFSYRKIELEGLSE